MLLPKSFIFLIITFFQKSVSENEVNELKSELAKITSAKEEKEKELELSRLELVKISSEKAEKEKDLELSKSQLVNIKSVKEEKEQTIQSLTAVMEKTKIEVEKTINRYKQLQSESEVKDKRIAELAKQLAERSVAGQGPSNSQSPVKMKVKGSDDRKHGTVKREKSSDEDNQVIIILKTHQILKKDIFSLGLFSRYK